MLNCLNTNPLDLRVIPDSTWLPRLNYGEGKNYSDESEDDEITIPTIIQEDEEYNKKIISVEETQYKESIFREYRKQEKLRIPDHRFSPSVSQTFFPHDRSIITEWIISTGLSLSLDIHTILLASKIFDYIVYSFQIERMDMKLYAGACLFIASKIESEDPEPICEHIASYITNTTSNDLVSAELKIASLLKFNLRFITPMMYIEHIFQQKDFVDSESFVNARYSIQACLYAAIISEECVSYTSEIIAYSALAITYSLFGIKYERIPQELITETTMCSSSIIRALHDAYTTKNSTISVLFPKIYALILVNFSDKVKE